MYKYMANINRPTNLFCTANIVEKLLMMTNILTLTPSLPYTTEISVVIRHVT